MSAAARLIPYLALLERCFPLEAVSLLARLTGWVLSVIQRKRRKAAERNLSLFGIKHPKSARIIRNWTRCVADQIRSLGMRRSELQGMVRDSWSANLNKALSEGRGVVLVTAHLGNYELAGSYLASFDIPIHAVVEEIRGGHTAAMNRIRRRFGMGVIAYSDVPGMLRVLRKGGILVLLADRNIGGKGVKVRFGSAERIVPQGPALLAQRAGSPLETGYFVLDRDKRRYVCVINPAIELADTPRKDSYAVTEKVTDELVWAIRAYPDQWFVFEDDWNC